MPRTIPILAAVLAALTIAAPAAPATPAGDPGDTYSPAATTSSPDEHPRSPGARDTARPKTPSDLTAALAQERYYMGSADRTPAPDAARPQTPPDITAALAQERYYMGQGDPSPITPSALPEIRTDDAPITSSAAPEIRTDDGIARLPFILGISGALIIGLATGSGLHLLRLRRRHATSTAT